jgi:predicted dienelactone hydrolase
MPNFMRVPFGFWLLPLLSLLVPLPAVAADRLTVAYGLIERSISIASLEAYAADGTIEGDFKSYVRYLDPEQLASLRRILAAKADLDAVAISQFLYTEQGEALLRRLGEVIRTESNLPGFYAIRAAMIKAAGEPEGLTPINVLDNFPLPRVRIDLERALQILGDLEELVRQTQGAIALIEQQSNLEALARPWIAFPDLPDLRSPGAATWTKQTISLNDVDRKSTPDRTFLTDIYLPAVQPAVAPPLIVISHGLGSDRSSYAYLAEQLASYGFAVAVPEHPGSSSRQIEALISGESSEVIEPSEFINRPLDIRYLLDQLEARSQTDPPYIGKLDVQRVGVIGQSLGGYTALALAGGEFNLEQLTQDCQNNGTFNLSLLLQCRALRLPAAQSFRDDRVKAAIAINPIGSSLFGKTDLNKIKIPVMLISSTADTVSPALPEQILPFTWLQTPHKYLTLLEGGTHFSTIDVPADQSSASGELVDIPNELVGPDPKIARVYVKAIGVAFFKTYVEQDSAFNAYLNAGYIRSISQRAFPIALVQALTAAQLAKIYREQPLEPLPTGFDPNTWSGQ